MSGLAQRKAVVIAFLHRCNAYADAELARYRVQLDVASDAAAALVLQDKISHWCAYKAFNEVAIGEIERAELDDWFEAPPADSAATEDPSGS